MKTKFTSAGVCVLIRATREGCRSEFGQFYGQTRRRVRVGAASATGERPSSEDLPILAPNPSSESSLGRRRSRSRSRSRSWSRSRSSVCRKRTHNPHSRLAADDGAQVCCWLLERPINQSWLSVCLPLVTHAARAERGRTSLEAIRPPPLGGALIRGISRARPAHVERAVNR